MTALRLMSYNVRSLRDDASAVASIIAACRPDVVCIQEAPRFLRWRSKCAALAREAGLVVVSGGRPAAAQLLLCRLGVDVRWSRDLRFPLTPGLHRRGMALAGLSLAGRDVVVAGIHLSLHADERVRHVHEILAVLAGVDAPVVVAGDLNEDPAGPAWGVLADRYADAAAVAGTATATYSSREPTKRIDAVFADPALAVRSCRVPDIARLDQASDHLPLLAEFDFAG